MLPFSSWGTLPQAAAYQSLPTSRAERASSAAGAAAASRRRHAVQLVALCVAGGMLLLCALVLHNNQDQWLLLGRQQPTAALTTAAAPAAVTPAPPAPRSNATASSANSTVPTRPQRPPSPSLRPAYEFDTSRSRWQPTILQTAALAEAMLGQTTPRKQRAGRLFIPLLTSRPENVCCMVKSYSRMLGQHNPSDFLVFSKGNAAQAAYQRACAAAQLPNIGVYFLALNEHWQVPDGSAANPSLQSYPTPVEYRLMGHWRLLMPSNLADMLGYRCASRRGHAWQAVPHASAVAAAG